MADWRHVSLPVPPYDRTLFPEMLLAPVPTPASVSTVQSVPVNVNCGTRACHPTVPASTFSSGVKAIGQDSASSSSNGQVAASDALEKRIPAACATVALQGNITIEECGASSGHSRQIDVMLHPMRGEQPPAHASEFPKPGMQISSSAYFGVPRRDLPSSSTATTRHIPAHSACVSTAANQVLPATSLTELRELFPELMSVSANHPSGKGADASHPSVTYQAPADAIKHSSVASQQSARVSATAAGVPAKHDVSSASAPAVMSSKAPPAPVARPPAPADFSIPATALMEL